MADEEERDPAQPLDAVVNDDMRPASSEPSVVSTSPVSTPPVATSPDAPSPIAPRLSYLAAFSAIGVLLIPRLLAPASVGRVSHGTLIDMLRGGEFLLHVAVLSGIYAFIAGLWNVVRDPDSVGRLAKVAIAGVAGLFVPTVFHALVTARARIPWPLVGLSMFSGTLLVLILGLAALRRGFRTTAAPSVLAFVVAGAASLVAITCELVPHVSVQPWAAGASHAARTWGELAYLAAPFLVVAQLLPKHRHARALAPLLIAVLASAVALVVFERIAAALGHGLADVLYFAQRLGAALEESPRRYVSVLACSLGIAVGAFSSPHAAVRLSGVGALLFVAAGFSPRAPASLLFAALAGLCWLRAAIAMRASTPLPRPGAALRG